MPEISVILPVYNAEAYLRQAIDSVLAQTFTDFELLIVDDGSTDRSAEIIRSYDDPRIRCLSNEGNKGLIYSLNRAIDEAKGRYLARMDADDICLPQRLEKQVRYLQKNNIAILATRANLINAAGNPLPAWSADEANVTFKNIRKFLLNNNCIPHPTVMGKTELFKHYKYHYNQKYSEDYDLWLRILADGLTIEKLDEPLLLHRILPSSATRFKKVNIFLRLAKVKFRFLWQEAKGLRLSRFMLSVFLFALLDLLKAAGKEVKDLLSK